MRRQARAQEPVSESESGESEQRKELLVQAPVMNPRQEQIQRQDQDLKQQKKQKHHLQPAQQVLAVSGCGAFQCDQRTAL